MLIPVGKIWIPIATSPTIVSGGNPIVTILVGIFCFILASLCFVFVVETVKSYIKTKDYVYIIFGILFFLLLITCFFPLYVK